MGNRISKIEDLGLIASLSLLCATSLVMFFSATSVVPAAKIMIKIINEYPESIFIDLNILKGIILLILWGSLTLICGILLQATNKHLVHLVMQGRWHASVNKEKDEGLHARE